VNDVALSYISALVGILRKIVTLLHGCEQDKHVHEFETCKLRQEDKLHETALF